ncbi:MAG TPA: hypothetical protein VJZ51_01220 [Bacilli bacterium]|nr:hypothetical protein [Bacilli bacterium]
MSNLTLLETILIMYIIVVNVLGVITITVAQYASGEVSDTILGIMLLVAIPIALPIVLFLLTVDKLIRRKRKQDLEQQYEDIVKENENE